MKKFLTSTLIAITVSITGTPAQGVDYEITVDGVSYPANKVVGSGPTIHYETPDTNPLNASDSRHVWSGNGSDHLPCAGGIHWISNANVLTISHCLGVVSTSTTTTTTVPVITTTTEVLPSTTTIQSTTTVVDTTSTTLAPPTTVGTTVLGSTSTTVPVTTTTVQSPTTTLLPTTTIVIPPTQTPTTVVVAVTTPPVPPTTINPVTVRLPETGLDSTGQTLVVSAILIAIGALALFASRRKI